MTQDKLSEELLARLAHRFETASNSDRAYEKPCSWDDAGAMARELLALRSATPMPEPVAWMTEDGRVASDETKRTAMARVSKAVFCIPLYTAPPAREISEAEVERAWQAYDAKAGYSKPERIRAALEAARSPS